MGTNYNVFSTESPSSSFEAKFKFVNGVQQSYTSFQASAIGYGGTLYNSFTGIMLSVGDPPILIAFDSYQRIYKHAVLTVTESSGLVSIKQDSYVSSSSYPEQESQLDFRDAAYQFNAQGTTYYYTAIG